MLPRPTHCAPEPPELPELPEPPPLFARGAHDLARVLCGVPRRAWEGVEVGKSRVDAESPLAMTLLSDMPFAPFTR